MGKVYVVGIGPGDPELMTVRARRVLRSVDVVIGYRSYVRHAREVIPDGVEVREYGMREERKRAREAVRLAAEGRRVAVVSGGDPGVYGMAGLVLSIAEGEGVEVEVVPGVTAACAAASLLGAPLMLDFAVVSLSDHLVPLDEILERARAALESDFVLVVYNPSSSERRHAFRAFLDVLEESVEPERPVGVVWDAYRSRQRVVVTRAGELRSLEDRIDMRSILIVGSSRTRVVGERMITERGYSSRRTGRNSRE
ncbi:precorrin-3B C(17)-methyltransferase [Methanopyrus sp.]